MGKGTPSFGKYNKTRAMRCRRCGRRAYNLRKRRCSACGFGRSKTIRSYNWQTKTLTRERLR